MNRSVLLRSLTLGFVLPVGVSAAPLTLDQALQLGKAVGTAGNGAVSNAAASSDFSTVPGYQGTQVPQTQYYGSGLGIEDAARQALPNSPVGSYVQSSALSRPQFTIDASDPMLQRGNAISNDPQSVLGSSLSGQFSACQPVSVTTSPATFTQDFCTAWGLDQTLSCQKTLNVSCTRPIECNAGAINLDTLQGDIQWTYTYPYLTLGTPRDNYWTGSCAVFDRRASFTIADITKVQDFTLIQAGFDDWMRIIVNGTLVYIGPYGGDRLDVVPFDPFGTGASFNRVQFGPSRYGSCELSTNWNETLNIDVKPYLHTGLNTIDMRVIVGGAGEGWMKFKATQYCDCQWSDTWDSTCSALDRQVQAGLCVLQSQSCTQPSPATRTVSGLPVTRDCWQYDVNFLCAGNGTREEPYCQELRDRGCSQVDSTCVTTLANGTCYEYRQTYQCPKTPATTQTVMNCGGQTFCLNGNCFDTGYTPDSDFALAASYLGAVDSAAQDFDTTDMVIFKGQGRFCSKAVLGFSNCCKDSGWGIDLSLAQCSAGEKTLGQQRQAGQCHYVGSYCSSSSLFGCLSESSGLCCFNSKLARIIQEQGRAQLRIGWGAADNPDCRGLTPAELTRIDFSRIDFSEFYGDAYANAAAATRPSAAQMQQILKQHIQSLLP
jgi:conjugal transfer mating pair stabilization protein TraN